MASIDIITQASHPLIGESTLAPRPHGVQAVPSIPPFSPHVTPPLAPVVDVDLEYREDNVRGLPELQFLERQAKVVDIRYKDGTALS